MTEATWLASTDLIELLKPFIGKGSARSARKLRLFAVSCCQPYKTMLTDDRCATALTVAERFAEGTASHQELASAALDVGRVLDEPKSRDQLMFAVWHAATYCRWANSSGNPLTNDRLVTLAEDAALYTSARVAQYRGGSVDLAMGRDGYDHAYRSERQAHAVLFRDIFGNPFRPITLDPYWRTSTVAQLAAGIYQDRAFDLMPILADALQDAGCDNEDVLDHCRVPAPHVRGCWVVDLLLGRE
jgi:hypothetical protein